jgi:copper chaperone NosL
MAARERHGGVDRRAARLRDLEVQVKACRAGRSGRRVEVVAAAALIAAAVAGCSGRAERAQAQDLTRDTVCALDGMLLMDYPGPKGQIHYDTGPPDFYCDTVEVLAMYLRPEQRRRVIGVFVQDMAKADWTQPNGHWIDARTAVYVFGSRRHGSMGPTAATFARDEDARQFVSQHGGRILRFHEITPEMVALDGGVLRDQRM